MSLTIILVSPVRAENVGAAARAMKTMGFSSLRVVASDAHLQPAARWVAHGAGEILDQVVRYDTLSAALADVDFAVATTARLRGRYRHYCSPQQLQLTLQERRQWCAHIGLIFGREESGLTNDELSLADLLTSIPMQSPYPSLNLGQAVMLYCYQLCALQQEHSVREPEQREGRLSALRKRINALLQKVTVSEDRVLSEWLDQRLGYLQKRDIALLHALLQNIDKKLSMQEKSKKCEY